MPTYRVNVSLRYGHRPEEQSAFTLNVEASNQPNAIALALFQTHLIDIDKPNDLPLAADIEMDVHCELFTTPC